jgi:hypothetical protein
MKKGHEFEMETNVADAIKMDDLVYTLRRPEVQEIPTTSTGRRYFLQLKHTDNQDKTKLVHSELVPLLDGCFESYCSIIDDPTYQDIPPERTEFIIYTNKQLGPKMLEKHARRKTEVDTIFKTCDKGEIFKLTPDDDKKIDVYRRVETLIKERYLIPPQQEFKLKIMTDFFNKLIMITGQKGHSELDNVIVDAIREIDGAVTVGP